MKKIITAIALTFAFTIAANAQDKKINREVEAREDVTALVEKIAIDQSLKDDMYALMLIKYDKLAVAQNDSERKEIYEAIEHKILAGLNDQQRKALIAEPELLKKLSR